MTVRHRKIALNSFMSIRLYIGNLPQTFDEQEPDALLKSVGEGIGSRRFWIVRREAAVDLASRTSMIRSLLM